MKAIKRPDQYLRLRGDIWHYVRRVPKAVSHIDDRILIYHSLDTDSRKVARQRRDICADADEQRWHEIVPGRFQSTPREVSFRNVSHHARSLGFNYEPMDSLVSRDTVTDLLHRLQALGPLQDAPQPKEERDADVLLGVAKKPSATITEAMDLYLSEIVADELSSKSPEQVKNFSKIKRRAVANFVNINGDIDMRDITCEHAHAVRKFWHERIHPKDGSKPMSGSSGNKDLGSLRKLYRRYFEHIGEEERENPFRNMRFKDKILTKVMPFKNEWVRSRILAPDVFDGLNRQGALLCMALIETGCRPSALANIKPENIRLDAEVPHIRIRPTKDRELKSGASVRDIPLVGVALEAMRQRAAHERSHRLRLEALTKAGVVTAVEYSPRDGRALAWQVPEDFESQAIALDLRQGRASGVTLLSVQDLNAQLASPGATWLDRAQVGWNKIEKVSAPQSVFTKEVKEAFRQRQEWLVERGHADVSHESDGKNYVTYKRGYVKALETEGFDAATQKIEGQTGKPFVAAQAGRLLEGTVSQKFELPHGPDAMIETQRAFYLVPWQSVHAQTWGKRIRGRVLSGGGIDWDAGRARGIGR